jgi:hypothetical protein
MTNVRTNMFIASWLCIILASGLVFTGAMGLVVGAPIGLAGAILLLFAIARVDEPTPMSEKAIGEWAPEGVEMPEGVGGSVMFRVDTTLDDPIKTSILCGNCGEVTWKDGKRPSNFTCPACETELWDHPEEEE